MVESRHRTHRERGLITHGHIAGTLESSSILGEGLTTQHKFSKKNGNESLGGQMLIYTNCDKKKMANV